MQANESIERYPQKVREYANYAYKSIIKVVKSYGPRPVGSENEKNAQEYLLGEAEKYCDKAERETFKCSDKAFMAWVPIGACLMVLSILFYTLGMAVVGLALTCVALFLILAEFIFYKPVLDVFFPKKESGNVVGVRKSAEETKRRIIISGHTDSAFEWTYTYHGGRPAVLTIILVAVLDIILTLGANIAYIVVYQKPISQMIWYADTNLVFKILACAAYATVPVLIMALFFTNYKRPVPGANDDLSGVFISLAAAKFLSDNKIRFKNTEVVVTLTGGEEAGLRGAKAFAKKHKDMLSDGTETVFVGFDTIREPEFFKIYDKDMTGVVKNDKKVAQMIQSAAKINELDIPIGTIELGSTDAAAFSQAGFRASSIVAMDPTPAKYYHTRLDAEDNLSLKAIEQGVKTALEVIFMFDEKGC